MAIVVNSDGHPSLCLPVWSPLSIHGCAEEVLHLLGQRQGPEKLCPHFLWSEWPQAERTLARELVMTMLSCGSCLT